MAEQDPDMVYMADDEDSGTAKQWNIKQTGLHQTSTAVLQNDWENL